MLYEVASWLAGPKAAAEVALYGNGYTCKRKCKREARKVLERGVKFLQATWLWKAINSYRKAEMATNNINMGWKWDSLREKCTLWNINSDIQGFLLNTQNDRFEIQSRDIRKPPRNASERKIKIVWRKKSKKNPKRLKNESYCFRIQTVRELVGAVFKPLKRTFCLSTGEDWAESITLY